MQSYAEVWSRLLTPGCYGWTFCSKPHFWSSSGGMHSVCLLLMKFKVHLNHVVIFLVVCMKAQFLCDCKE